MTITTLEKRFSPKIAAIGVIFLVLSVGFVVTGVPRWATAWDAERQTAAATNVASEPGQFAGVWLIIEVGGERHRCAGEGKYPPAGDYRTTVVYDPASPGHCRQETLKGKLSDYEKTSMMVNAIFIVMGSVFTAISLAVWRRRRRRVAALLKEVYPDDET